MDIENRQGTSDGRIDELISNIDRLLSSIDLVVSKQERRSKSETMAAWGSAAVTSCFFTFLGLLLFAIWAIPEIHDLKAWVTIHTTHINALETKKEGK